MYERCYTGVKDMDGTPIHEGDVLELDIEHERYGTGPTKPYKPLLGTVHFAEGCFKIKTAFAYNWAYLHSIADKSRIYKEPRHAEKETA